METDHTSFMRAALAQAQEALEAGEVPVGCVFVQDGIIVGKGRNATNETLNATSHAELMAMQKMDINNVKNMDLYVTIEPCIMCAAALRQVGIKHVYYGAGNEKFGGCGSVLNLHQEDSKYPPYQVTSGLLEEDAIIILRKFYITENDHAPIPRKKTNRILKPVEKVSSD
ncbi:tRNA(adenine34) deaminase [Boothiomyces sp. JEL0866]|nr:tRNA(adenine34) deaminase [Boothiomyces sp. JEL0866]